MVYQHNDENNKSVEEAVNEGMIELEDVLPGSLNGKEADAYSMITRAGGSGESYEGPRGPSKVVRRINSRGETVQPIIFKKPNYLVRMPIKDWFYHPDVSDIKRVFKVGDNVAELDVETTLNFLNVLGLSSERKNQIRSALEMEVSLTEARNPENVNAEKIFKNIELLQGFYESHKAGQPIMPSTVYRLKEIKKTETTETSVSV